MAYEEILVTTTALAGADLSAAQFKFVKLNSSDAAVLCDTAGEQAYGILQNNPASGGEATIAIGGISKFAAGDTVAAGATVSTAADGEGVTSATADHIFLGICREGAGDGEIGSVDFRSYLGAASA